MIEQTTLSAMYQVDEVQKDQQYQKIIACLSHGGTDRSHIQVYTKILDQTLGWRIKELRQLGCIREDGECISVYKRRAKRLILT